MEFLLDTDGCISYMRGDNPQFLARISAIDPSRIALCSVVLAEQVRDFSAQFVCLPFDEQTARTYADFYAAVKKRGTMIGQMDLQIAAIAEVHGLTLVTHNTKDFARIPGLKLEDWQV